MTAGYAIEATLDELSQFKESDELAVAYFNNPAALPSWERPFIALAVHAGFSWSVYLPKGRYTHRSKADLFLITQPLMEAKDPRIGQPFVTRPEMIRYPSLRMLTLR